MCRELAELGMNVARAAAREAIAELNTPIEHPMPGMNLPPVCRTAHPGLLFARVSRAVRQALILETHIAAGSLSSPRAPLVVEIQAPRPRPAETGRTPAQTVRTHRTARPEALEPFEDECAATEIRSVPEILAAIRQTLGVAQNLLAPAAHTPDTGVRPHRAVSPAAPPPPPRSAPPSVRAPTPPRPG